MHVIEGNLKKLAFDKTFTWKPFSSVKMMTSATVHWPSVPFINERQDESEWK